MTSAGGKSGTSTAKPHLDHPQDGLHAGVAVGQHQRRAVLTVLLAMCRQTAHGMTAKHTVFVKHYNYKPVDSGSLNVLQVSHNVGNIEGLCRRPVICDSTADWSNTELKGRNTGCRCSMPDWALTRQVAGPSRARLAEQIPTCVGTATACCPRRWHDSVSLPRPSPWQATAAAWASQQQAARWHTWQTYEGSERSRLVTQASALVQSRAASMARSLRKGLRKWGQRGTRIAYQHTDPAQSSADSSPAVRSPAVGGHLPDRPPPDFALATCSPLQQPVI